MKQDFLESEAKCGKKRNRKTISILFIIVVSLYVFLYFATRNDIDLSKSDDRMLFMIFIALAAVMLFSVLVQLIWSILPAKNGKNLILPLEETDRQTAAEIINREVAEGRVLFEKDVEAENTVWRGKYHERIMLLPSYLIWNQTSGRVTAVPRSKIYWIGVKTAYRRDGDLFYVKLFIFTEKKLLDIEGNDVEHTQKLAEELYRYIPNVFKNAEAMKKMGAEEFTYFLEQLFNRNHREFLEFYETEKKNMQEDL